MKAISKAAVIGAGIMGAGIAAQMANAGMSVVLLDVVPDGEGDRSRLARSAIERLKTSKPPALAEAEVADRIVPGNLQDDLHLIADVEWVVEAVVEDLGVKRRVLATAAEAAPRALICSNTSTLSLAVLTEGFPPSMAERMLITHFFNPPRQMRLLELVSGPQNPSEIIARARWVSDVQMGKTVVSCSDTPGFLANRLGTYWMCQAVCDAARMGIGPAEADTVLASPFGIPPTGVFHLLDLIGIDTVEKGCASLLAALPADDPFQDVGGRARAIFADMAARELLGRKAKSGFFRSHTGPDGRRSEQELDFKTLEYGEPKILDPKSLPGGGRDLLALIQSEDRLGKYARSVMLATFGYACGLISTVTDNPADLDEAMRLGYGWRRGPFALMDAIGLERLSRLYPCAPGLLGETDGTFFRIDGGVRSVSVGKGRRIPIERGEGVLRAEDVRKMGPQLAGNAAASLHDMGDGVALFEIHTKMNALDEDVVAVLRDALRIGDGRFSAMVIGGDGANFSAGANLAATLDWIRDGDFSRLERTLSVGQKAMLELKYAPFPVIAAVSGAALGGGCEIVLHCAAVQAHLECTIGLVERTVGIVPGWGGIAQMLARHAEASGGEPVRAALGAFGAVVGALTAGSSASARRLHFLRDGDRTSMNRDRLLFDAKQRGLELAPGYRPPPRFSIAMGQESQRMALAMALTEVEQDPAYSPYDVEIAANLARILGGGDAPAAIWNEEAIHELERAAILRLVRDPRTIARMEHMLATGKPLRN